MGLFKKNEYIKITDVNQIINNLDTNLKISYDEFSNYYDVFSKEKELDNINSDDKLILASFLAHNEVEAARNKSFDIMDKKLELYSYTAENMNKASDEATLRISKHVEDVRQFKEMEKALTGDKRTINEVFRDIAGDLKDTKKRHK